MSVQMGAIAGEVTYYLDGEPFNCVAPVGLEPMGSEYKSMILLGGNVESVSTSNLKAKNTLGNGAKMRNVGFTAGLGCGNGIQDPGELGVDCGGPCPCCADLHLDLEKTSAGKHDATLCGRSVTRLTLKPKKGKRQMLNCV